MDLKSGLMRPGLVLCDHGQESEHNSCEFIAACLEEVAVKCPCYGAPSDMALASEQIENIMKELLLLIVNYFCYMCTLDANTAKLCCPLAE